MRKLLVFLLSLLAVMSIGLPKALSTEASLRQVITVKGEIVRLSDLFAGLEPGQDCDIGPSPAPGKRINIPLSQLVAIASEFGVDWEPGSSYQSATLERLARPVTREELLAVLRPALIEDGANSQSDVSLAAFVSPNLPLEITAPPEIQTLDYEPQNGKFSAILLFIGSGAEQVTVRVVGRAEEQVSVMTLTHALPAGAVLSPDDLQPKRIRLNSLRGVPVTEAAETRGLALRRPLGDGVPLLRDMLVRPMLIGRGQPVVLRLQVSGLQLTAAGIALEAGGEGDRIRVVNSLSHAILVGQITADAEVQIDPNTAPLIAQATGGGNGLPRVPNEALANVQDFRSYAQEAQNR